MIMIEEALNRPEIRRNGRRGREEIMHANLMSCSGEPVNRTNIGFDSALNWERVVPYLDYLKGRNLVEEIDLDGKRWYKITGRGYRALELLGEIITMLRGKFPDDSYYK